MRASTTCARITGYDTDSRKAEATYRAVQRQTKGLRRLMGDDFAALVYGTEDGHDSEAAIRRFAAHAA